MKLLTPSATTNGLRTPPLSSSSTRRTSLQRKLSNYRSLLHSQSILVSFLGNSGYGLPVCLLFVCLSVCLSICGWVGVHVCVRGVHVCMHVCIEKERDNIVTQCTILYTLTQALIHTMMPTTTSGNDFKRSTARKRKKTKITQRKESTHTLRVQQTQGTFALYLRQSLMLLLGSI